MSNYSIPDDGIHIHIDMPGEEKDLVSEIKALAAFSVKKPKVDIRDDSAGTLVMLKPKEKGEKKKKKGGKKGRIELDFLMDSLMGGESSEGEESEGISQSAFIDVDEIFRERDEDDDDLTNGIIGEQKQGYEKRKKDQNQYKKEFAEEVTMLYDLLDEINKFSKELEKRYKDSSGSRVRGTSKYINDLIISILNSKNSKLNVIKEIANIKKLIEDFKLKADSKAAKSEEGKSQEATAAMYLKNLLNYGRNNFIRDYTGGANAPGGPDIEDMADSLSGNDNDSDRDFDLDDDYNERINELIEDRLDNENNIWRSNDADKYIEYESRGVKIYISKETESNDWEFIALDQFGQEVPEYPLPKKKDVGKMKFGDDGKNATDSTGRPYKVIERKMY